MPAKKGQTIRCRNESERDFLARCLLIRHADTGSNSPFEDFFTSLAYAYGSFPMTPDSLTERIEEFRQNWDGMSRDVSTFIDAFPETLIPAEILEASRQAAHEDNIPLKEWIENALRKHVEALEAAAQAAETGSRAEAESAGSLAPIAQEFRGPDKMIR